MIFKLWAQIDINSLQYLSLIHPQVSVREAVTIPSFKSRKHLFFSWHLQNSLSIQPPSGGPRKIIMNLYVVSNILYATTEDTIGPNAWYGTSVVFYLFKALCSIFVLGHFHKWAHGGIHGSWSDGYQPFCEGYDYSKHWLHLSCFHDTCLWPHMGLWFVNKNYYL